jgi:hypothetical protein
LIASNFRQLLHQFPFLWLQTGGDIYLYRDQVITAADGIA